MGTFDAAFSDRPAPAKTEVVEEPLEKEEVAEDVEEKEVPETTDGQPAKEPEKEPAKEPEPTVKTVPHQALHAERLRREAAEARLAELERQPKARTSVLDDEDKAFQERQAEATAPLRQQFFKLSVKLAKSVAGREDYDEIYDFMNAEIQTNPQLYDQLDQDDPGESIYRIGKLRKELAEVGGDFSKYREHITAKTQAEMSKLSDENKSLKAELAALKASAEKKARIPSSLNAEPSGPTKDEVFAGPKPLKAVFS